MIYFRNWIVGVYQTPIWRERLKEYGKWLEDTFIFSDEDKEEEFYNQWNYEPDEQPKEIQDRCIGKIS